MGSVATEPATRAGDVRPTRLSIVIPSYRARTTIERCLAALVPQCRSAPAEIVVVDSGDDGTAELVAKRFPGVALVRSPDRLDPGAARNLGIARARGSVLGFVDADCIAAHDWVARVLDAHARSGSGAVGGAIGIAEPRGLLDWAAYFCSFHAWMPGTPAGAMDDIPTCCLSVERSAFERHGPFRERGYSSDTEFNWRLAREGRALRFDPRIAVAHLAHPTPLGFALRLLIRGRAFARMRVVERRLPAWRRALHAVSCPLLPFVLFARFLLRAARRDFPYRPQVLAAAPLVLLGFGLWSAGEFSGYVRR